MHTTRFKAEILQLTEVVVYDDDGGATEAEHSIRRLRVCE